MAWVKSIVLALPLSWLLALAPARAETESQMVHRCSHPQVFVLASSKKDMEDACQGVSKALSFFASHELYLTGPVVLEIKPKLPEKAPPTAVGVYSSPEKRIYLLSFDEFRQFKTWFKQPISRELYQSTATHEMAHAITDGNFTTPQPTLQAKEYLAYVAMLATMSSPLRKQILLALPGNGFDDEYQISPLIYSFDPMMFGVQAYRHYMRLKNPRDFLRAVLAGDALFDLGYLY